MWEFKKEGVYNFLSGQFDQILFERFSSCSKFFPVLFSELPFPKKLIELVQLFIEDNKQQFFSLLIGLRLLFPPVKNRKNQPSIWLHAISNTYKTTLIKKFLENDLNK